MNQIKRHAQLKRPGVCAVMCCVFGLVFECMQCACVLEVTSWPKRIHTITWQIRETLKIAVLCVLPSLLMFLLLLQSYAKHCADKRAKLNEFRNPFRRTYLFHF